ncbi:MAG: SCP2 domain-containing protein [Granulosicoccus sp.]
MSSFPSPVNAAIERAIEALLQLDPDTRQRLSSLEGKVIAINIIQPTVSVVLSIVDQRVNVIGHVDTPADTTLTGTLSALRSLSSRNDALYQGDVTVEGDIGIGQELKEIVASLNPDWEEFLSPMLGDTVVHKLSVFGQDLSSWMQRTRSAMQQNTSEYLQEEAEVLAPNSEIQAFCIEVDEVRAAGDRLEARVSRLELQRQGEGA